MTNYDEAMVAVTSLNGYQLGTRVLQVPFKKTKNSGASSGVSSGAGGGFGAPRIVAMDAGFRILLVECGGECQLAISEECR